MITGSTLTLTSIDKNELIGKSLLAMNSKFLTILDELKLSNKTWLDYPIGNLFVSNDIFPNVKLEGLTLIDDQGRTLTYASSVVTLAATADLTTYFYINSSYQVDWGTTIPGTAKYVIGRIRNNSAGNGFVIEPWFSMYEDFTYTGTNLTAVSIKAETKEIRTIAYSYDGSNKVTQSVDTNLKRIKTKTFSYTGDVISQTKTAYNYL